VNLVEKAHAPDGGVAHQRAVHRDVVGEQEADDLAVGCLAARLPAVADDIDDALAAARLAGQQIGGVKNGVIEGVRLLGHHEEAAVATLRRQVGVHLLAIDGRAGHHGTADGRHAHALAGALGGIDGCDQARAGCRSKVGGQLRSGAAVGDHGRRVIRSQARRDGIDALIDLAHYVAGQGLIDNEDYRHGIRVWSEIADVLTHAVFKDTELTPGETCDRVPMLVEHGDRNVHIGDRNPQDIARLLGRNLRRRLLLGVAGRGGSLILLILSLRGWSVWRGVLRGRCGNALAGSHLIGKLLQIVRLARRSLWSWRIRNRLLLLCGSCSP